MTKTDISTHDTSLFSENMHRIGNRIHKNIREDLENLFWLGAGVYAFFTVIMIFWWKTIGSISVYAYQQVWYETYPTLPIDESYTWHFLLMSDKLTGLFLLVTWMLILILAIFMCIPHNPKYETQNHKKRVVQIIDKNNKSHFFTFDQAMKYMDNIGKYSEEDISNLRNNPKPAKKPKQDICSWCDSTKVRVAGKKHPGKMYCKSCQEFY